MVEAGRTGLTRLEVSICPGYFKLHEDTLQRMKALWHKRVQSFLNMFVKDVLNDQKLMSKLYRRLSVPDLLGRLRCCKVNLLLIGRENSWLVNTKTTHNHHFVGTKQAVGFST